MDGIGIRLPTICIRPGLPNKAASGFFSNILREPLAARKWCCRSPRTSPLACHAALGGRFSAACGDHGQRGSRPPPQPHHARPVRDRRRTDRGAEAVAGDTVAARIKREPDPFIMGIVDVAAHFDASGAATRFTTAEKT